ncbi:fumarylacetoacetate hydrolase family protein [Streptomyces sp. NPDC058371]|uniref:fumarylacetoacetate hydrolase family protein n=1 Tax=Streptomyces sp. NPDC058371 TaxID=3346463 RepID=UPI0036525936
MKIASRRTPFGDRLCFAGVVPHQLVDIQAAFVRRLETDGVHRDDALTRSRVVTGGDLPSLLRQDPRLDEIRRLHDWAAQQAHSGIIDEDCLWSDDPARLGPPVGRPRTVWCMLANYPRHPVAGREAPPRRGMQGCLKAPNALAGPADDLLHPMISEKVDPEVELAVVIGPRSRHLTPDNAMRAVAGYVAFCDTGSRDVSDRDNNRMDRAKGFDTYGITGPWFVTADEIPDPHALRIRSWVNGELRQDGSTAEMINTVPEQLAWLTEALTLAPGDLLSTGTPPGHGAVRPGDVVRGEIDGLGVIENKVVLDDPAHD